ncbi:MAG: peptide deformylase [Ignavibacteria bacterium]
MQKQLPITTYGMRILREKSAPVTDVDDRLIELITNMFYTMKNAGGIGLAAPQVNVGLSLTVVDISDVENYESYKPLTLINPEIIETYGNIEIEEGCLSIPEVRGIISRPEQIYLKYYDLDMKEQTLEAGSLLARVIQHEIDHLNGILFIDYLDEDTLKKHKSILRKIQKQKIEVDYPLYTS